MSNPSFKQLIERCTSEFLPSEDWDSMVALNDVLCQRPDEVTPVVVQCILQRLSEPNIRVQLLSITLLDFCVKNSTVLFIRTLEKPSNLSAIETLARSPNQQISKRAREVLGEWAKELGQKHPAFVHANARITSGQSVAPPQPQSQPQNVAIEQQTPVSKKSKLKKDLDAVRDNVDLLVEIVSSASLYKDIMNQATFQIVADCREMHRRIISLIEKIPEESVLLELLQVNDELAAAIDFYGTLKSTGKKGPVPPKAFRGSGASASVAPLYAPEPVAPRPAHSAPDLFVEPSAPPAASQSLFSLDDLLGTPSSSQPSLGVGAPVPLHPPVAQQPLVQQQQQQPAFIKSNVNPFDYSAAPLQQQQQQQFVRQQQQQQQQQQPMDPFELVINDTPPVARATAAPPPVAKSEDPFLIPPPKSDMRQQNKRRQPSPVQQNHPTSGFINFLDQAESKSSSSQEAPRQPSGNSSNKPNQLFSLD